MTRKSRWCWNTRVFKDKVKCSKGHLLDFHNKKESVSYTAILRVDLLRACKGCPDYSDEDEDVRL